MDKPTIMKGADPFFYPGNEVGCLVVHGFTGQPGEVRWLGQHLNRQGCTVYGPRLAGHGTHINDMASIRWREWYIDVLAAYNLLRARCDKVFVLGLSMGGALAAALASREAVDGLVTMSAIYEITDWRARVLGLLSPFMKSLPKQPPEEDPFQETVIAEQRARGEEPIGHPSYPGYPLNGLRQLQGLLKFVRAGLSQISAPVLLIHSRTDDVVPFENLDRYVRAVGSADKQALILENSLHVITEDVEREVVFEAVSDFIAAHQ